MSHAFHLSYGLPRRALLMAQKKESKATPLQKSQDHIKLWILSDPLDLEDQQMFSKMMAAIGMSINEYQVLDFTQTLPNDSRPLLIVQSQNSFNKDIQELSKNQSSKVFVIDHPKKLALDPTLKKKVWSILQSLAVVLRQTC